MEQAGIAKTARAWVVLLKTALKEGALDQAINASLPSSGFECVSSSHRGQVRRIQNHRKSSDRKLPNWCGTNFSTLSWWRDTALRSLPHPRRLDQTRSLWRGQSAQSSGLDGLLAQLAMLAAKEHRTARVVEALADFPGLPLDTLAVRGNSAAEVQVVVESFFLFCKLLLKVARSILTE